MINTKLQNIIDTKSAIGNAIVNKGGTITSETPFYNYAAQIDNISTGSVLTGNAAVGDVVSGKTFYSNDANTQLTGTLVPTQIDGVDESFIPFLSESNSYGGNILSLAANNGFVYVGGVSNTIQKFYQSNLVFVNNTNTGGSIFSIAINNGFIYAQSAFKYNESTLEFVGNGSAYGGNVKSIAINNGFIYVGGVTANVVRKYSEDNLALVGNTATYGNGIESIAINNGFIYAGGGALTGTNRGVAKYHESNLVLVGNTVNFGTGRLIETITVNNGFIYAGGEDSVVRRYNESTLAFVDNSSDYGSNIYSIKTNNGFIYVAGGTSAGAAQRMRKYQESNFLIIKNAASYGGSIESIAIDNGSVYIGGRTNQRIQKFQESTPFTNNLNGQAYYLIPKE
jgi:alpha-acetolactate decarboxylase